MNNSLNLASKPFSNRLLPWTVTTIILFVSLVGLVMVFQLTTSAREEAALLEAEINSLKKREHDLLDAAKTVKSSFTGDQQQALPAAHALVDRKAFSWSRLLADLETSLPNNVKVSRIAVREVSNQAGQTVAQLDMTVFTQNSATISEMISAMHREGIFQVEVRNQNLAKGRGESGSEFELFVVYRSRAAYSAESVAEVDASRDTGEVPR